MKIFFINIIMLQEKYFDEGVEIKKRYNDVNDVSVRSENFQ